MFFLTRHAVAARTVALLFSLGVIASAHAATLQPTLAWSRPFNIGTSDQIASGLDTDASGYAYFAYVSHEPTANVLHLAKIGPAKDVPFDGVVASMPVEFRAAGVWVSPKIAGKQYVYVAGQFVGDRGNQVLVKKYDTSFVSQWTFPFLNFVSATKGHSVLLGLHPDIAGNCDFVLNQDGVTRFVGIDSAGSISSDNTDPYMDPTQAVYYPARDEWLACGRYHNPDGTFDYPQTVWGNFSPTGGSGGFGWYAGGSNQDPATGAFSSLEFRLSVMASGDFALIGNLFSGHYGVVESTAHFLDLFHATLLDMWHFPTNTGTNGGMDPGQAYQVDAFSTAGPVYVNGRNQPNDAIENLDLFGYVATGQYLGNRLAHRNSQPIDQFFITPEGFYSTYYQASTNTVFLERYDNASSAYDFGKTYSGTGVVPNSFVGFKPFQNFFYVVHNISNATTNMDVVVDRFVTGICMQSITCLSTVKGGTNLVVHINLNAPAPTGGITVGLNSSTANLPMPNGLRGQNFTVPAGATFVSVNLTPRVVTVNSSATLLAIQNGIRRGAATTITP